MRRGKEGESEGWTNEGRERISEYRLLRWREGVKKGGHCYCAHSIRSFRSGV